MRKTIAFVLSVLLTMTPILALTEFLKANFFGVNVWGTAPTKGLLIILIFCYVVVAVIALPISRLVGILSGSTIKNLIIIMACFSVLFYLVNKITYDFVIFGGILSEIIFIPSIIALFIKSYVALSANQKM